MTRTDDAPLRRLLGVVVDPQTYRNAAYLLLSFPLGVFYFTVLVSGGAAGIATIPILVGIPILAAVLVFATHLAELESRLADGMLGTDVAYVSPQPEGETIVPYVTRLARDPATYLAVGYLFSKFAIGVAAFTLLVTAAAVSVTFAFAPLLYDVPGVAYQVGTWEVETVAGAAGLSVVGVVGALATLHLLNLAAWLVGEYTEVVLGSATTGEEEGDGDAGAGTVEEPTTDGR